MINTLSLSPCLKQLQAQNKSIAFGIKDGKYQLKLVDSDFMNHAEMLKTLSYSLAANSNPKVEDKIDVKIHRINIKENPTHVLERLKELNKLADTDPESIDYALIPLFSKVNLAFLSGMVKKYSGKSINFTPENLASNSKIVRESLKDISQKPLKYQKFITEFKEVDPYAQSLEYVYPTITELEKLKQKGVNVFNIGYHSYMFPIKKLASERNLKPELYSYIATGKDPGNKISKLSKEIENNKSYDVNLYNFADINKVSMIKSSGQRHIYANKESDSLVNIRTRGTFNFSPVRKNNKLLGYSFLDEKQVHVPAKDFKPNNNIERFVGLPISDFLAKKEDYITFKDYMNLKKQKNTESSEKKLVKLQDKIKNKLFEINSSDFKKIFPNKEIQDLKMPIQGDYVDYQMLFYKKNKKNQVIFPNADCEGSGRPSVCSMFGVCLALAQSVINDISSKVKNKEQFGN